MEIRFLSEMWRVQDVHPESNLLKDEQLEVAILLREDDGTGLIPLGVKFAARVLKDPGSLPVAWRAQPGMRRYIRLEGAVAVSETGRRGIPCLRHDAQGVTLVVVDKVTPHDGRRGASIHSAFVPKDLAVA